eukprot:5731519-Prymnesium_polylepis.1
MVKPSAIQAAWDALSEGHEFRFSQPPPSAMRYGISQSELGTTIGEDVVHNRLSPSPPPTLPPQVPPSPHRDCATEGSAREAASRSTNRSSNAPILPAPARGLV